MARLVEGPGGVAENEQAMAPQSCERHAGAASAPLPSSYHRREPEGTILHAVVHSDNGKPMRGSTMLAMLQWLGIVPSFSRPHVSNDNPYSESLFRTLKQTPAYPSLPFAGAGTARAWITRFVAWYNTEHRHSGIRYVTPDQRHRGDDQRILARRAELYEAARRRRPERWTRHPRNWASILGVTLNPTLPRPADAA